MKTMYLIGFMGCGKSTIGQNICTQLSKTYVDTDEFIVQKYNQTISHIFESSGEETFRTYETSALKDVSTKDIVSTGGGIVEYDQNIGIMKKNGVIVYLQTSFIDIKNRLESDQTRPLWDSKRTTEMELLYNRRIELYEKYADYTIKTACQSIEEIVLEVSQLLKRINSEE